MGSRNCHLMMVVVASCHHWLEKRGHLGGIVRTSLQGRQRAQPRSNKHEILPPSHF